MACVGAAALLLVRDRLSRRAATIDGGHSAGLTADDFRAVGDDRGAGGHEMYLSCPHCDYGGPLDDPNLVGQTVDCPLCQQSILVLEPYDVCGQPAGVN